MATQKTKIEKLVEEAEALGVEVVKKDNEKTLTEKIKVKKQEIADAKKAEAEEAKNKKIYYLVKVKSFINESETIEAGLYETKTENARLSASRKEYVEMFISKIPDAKLYKIAETYKVSVFEKNGEEARKSSEILAELVKPL